MLVGVTTIYWKLATYLEKEVPSLTRYYTQASSIPSSGVTNATPLTTLFYTIL